MSVASSRSTVTECAGMLEDKFTTLNHVPSDMMFFSLPKVTLDLKCFNDIELKQKSLDKVMQLDQKDSYISFNCSQFDCPNI